MAKKVVKWGGKRKGAGAKPKPPKEKAVRLEIYAPKFLIDSKGEEEVKAELRKTIKQMVDESQ